MNNERYWIDRANYLIYHHMSDAEQTADEIATLYRKAYKWLIYESRKIFDRYQNSHGLTEAEARRLISQLQGSSSLEELKRLLEQDGRNQEILAQLDAPAYQFRIDRLRQIQNQLDIVMNNVYQQEKILAGDFFVDLANDSYYRQIYEIQHNTSYAFSFAHIDRKQIDKVISIPWSGKHYSERLWKNSKTLTKAIKEELLIDLITGRPENEAVKIIANKFDQGIFEARRLVRTEAAFVSGELNAEAYEECDLQKYQFLATLDLRTSEICRSLDGKRFFLKDRQEFDRAFDKYDVILAPAAPYTAPKIGESLKDPLAMYLGDIYTVAVNLCGLPGITVPCGQDKAGMPIGIQMIGNCFGEHKILRAAAAYEAERGAFPTPLKGGKEA